MLTRPATPADADELAAAHVAAWRAGYRDVMPAEYLAGLSVERFAANWARQLVDLDALVGLLDDRVLVWQMVGSVMPWRPRSTGPAASSSPRPSATRSD